MGTNPSIDFTFVREHEPCTLAKLAAEHSTDMVDALAGAIDQILEHRRINGARAVNGPNAQWLRRKLAEHGIKVSDQMLNRHIRGACSCVRVSDD